MGSNVVPTRSLSGRELQKEFTAFWADGPHIFWGNTQNAGSTFGFTASTTETSSASTIASASTANMNTYFTESSTNSKGALKSVNTLDQPIVPEVVAIPKAPTGYQA